jgi:hypothetical protein
VNIEDRVQIITIIANGVEKYFRIRPSVKIVWTLVKLAVERKMGWPGCPGTCHVYGRFFSPKKENLFKKKGVVWK